MEVLIQDIAELIPALGYSSCILGAHDWGGGVAWYSDSHVNCVLIIFLFLLKVCCSEVP